MFYNFLLAAAFDQRYKYGNNADSDDVPPVT